MHTLLQSRRAQAQLPNPSFSLACAVTHTQTHACTSLGAAPSHNTELKHPWKILPKILDVCLCAGLQCHDDR